MNATSFAQAYVIAHEVGHHDGGRVVPEKFTHGSSAQRVEWLRRGLASGRCEDCDTFSAGVP